MAAELASDLYYAYLTAVFPSQNLGLSASVSNTCPTEASSATSADGQPMGTFDGYDMARLCHGVRRSTARSKAASAASFIYSHLAPQGAGAEQGAGTASDFALDFGLLYHINPN